MVCRVSQGGSWGGMGYKTTHNWKRLQGKWCFHPPPSHTLLWPVNTLWIDRSLPSCFWCCCWPLLVVFCPLLYYASRNPQCTRNPKSQQTHAYQHYIIYKAVGELATKHTNKKNQHSCAVQTTEQHTTYCTPCVPLREGEISSQSLPAQQQHTACTKTAVRSNANVSAF